MAHVSSQGLTGRFSVRIWMPEQSFFLLQRAISVDQGAVIVLWCCS